jgi:hypothetical protein
MEVTRHAVDDAQIARRERIRVTQKSESRPQSSPAPI